MPPNVTAMLPFAPFIIGVGAIFIYGGSMTFMVVGDTLILLAGIAFIRVLK